ncbi:AAA family ATPase, partial [Ewingella americana]|uniref:AAA family ATPase n=1 Tax=Ewingella americana TaxID=41202 RepID=UPI0012AE5C19
IEEFLDNDKIKREVKEKYHNIEDIILKISSKLSDLNKRKRVNLVFTVSDADLIIELVKLVNYLPQELSSRFHYGWGSLSSGEFAKINIFNQIYHALKDSNGENFILLLDECDLYLHPEWQRLFIFEVLSFIRQQQGFKKIQLIATTHSPIIASDFLPNNIIHLQRKRSNTILVKMESGFGATISELYVDGFFIDATMGKLALNYIKEIINNSKNKSINPQQELIIEQIKNELLLHLVRSEE